MRFLICAALLVAVSANAQQPADAAPEASILTPLNSHLPSWLRLSGEYRVRAEGFEGASYTPGNNQGYLLSRLRLNLDLHASWFRLYAQTEDSRALGNSDIPDASPYQDRFDLRQAFIELGSTANGHFAVRAGRQELSFGDQRMVGPSTWSSIPRTFDAVRADVGYGNVRVTAFASSLVNPVEGEFNHSRSGNNLHGLYGTISKLLPGTTVEPYFLWRLDGPVKDEESATARRSAKTAALRVARAPKTGFDYDVQLLRQFGTIGPDKISSYAMNLLLGYSWPDRFLHPRVYADYTYASGDHDPRDGRINTFFQGYPSNHAIYGTVDLFGFQNLRDEKFALELKPTGRISVATIYHNLNLADAHDALYASNGSAVVRVPAGTDGTRIGGEAEATGVFNMTKYLSSGAGYGHVFPGEFLRKATKGSSYSLAYLFFTYTF